jgi:hypothetical protein
MMIPAQAAQALIEHLGKSPRNIKKRIQREEASVRGNELVPIQFGFVYTGLPEEAPHHNIAATGGASPLTIIKSFHSSVSTGLLTEIQYYFLRFYGTIVDVQIAADAETIAFPPLTDALSLNPNGKPDVQLPPLVYMYLGSRDTAPPPTGFELPELTELPNGVGGVYWCYRIASLASKSGPDASGDYVVGVPANDDTDVDGSFTTDDIYDPRGPQDFYLCVSAPGLTGKFKSVRGWDFDLEEVQAVATINVPFSMVVTETIDNTEVGGGITTNTYDDGTIDGVIEITKPVQRVLSASRLLNEHEFLDGRLIKTTELAAETVYEYDSPP